MEKGFDLSSQRLGYNSTVKWFKKMAKLKIFENSCFQLYKRHIVSTKKDRIAYSTSES